MKSEWTFEPTYISRQKVMRPVTPADHEAVAKLLDEAFAPSRYESALVARLREREKPVREWVMAEGDENEGGGLAGYVCYTRAFRGDEVIGYHMAPVAVRADLRKQGIGSALIRESLKQVGDGEGPVFVLGDPRYYRRFGFARVESPVCPFDPGNEHFMALRWTEGPAFTVGYEEEFGEE